MPDFRGDGRGCFRLATPEINRAALPWVSSPAPTRAWGGSRGPQPPICSATTQKSILFFFLAENSFGSKTCSDLMWSHLQSLLIPLSVNIHAFLSRNINACAYEMLPGFYWRCSVIYRPRSFVLFPTWAGHSETFTSCKAKPPRRPDGWLIFLM